jgi:hypothetical protein
VGPNRALNGYNAPTAGARSQTSNQTRKSCGTLLFGEPSGQQQDHIQRELVARYLNRLPLVAQMRLDCRGDLGNGDGAVAAEGVEVCEGVEQ